MRVNKRRSDIEIIAEMLTVGKIGAGKTEIMYNVNMSYSQMQKYLHYLLDEGFINIIGIGNPSVYYHVTEKGKQLLKLLVNVKKMLRLDNIVK